MDFVPTGGKLSALAYATVSLFDVDRHWSIGPRQDGTLGGIVISCLTHAMRRPPKLPPDAKTQALREAGALHPHPEAVRDEAKKRTAGYQLRNWITRGDGVVVYSTNPSYAAELTKAPAVLD